MFQCVHNSASDYDWIKAWGPIIVGMISVFAALYSNRKLLKSKSKEEERNEINKKLTEFYGPFTQLRSKSDMLYRMFTKDKGEHYKTLTAMLNGAKYNQNDKNLLDQIILIDRQLEDLIVNKSGYVDDYQLRILLGKAATHFNVMSLAFNGLIKGDEKKFDEYVFPRELDDKIEIEIKKLQEKLKKLN